VDKQDCAMAHILGQKEPQLNSKNRKKNKPVFCKTFTFIPACAGIKYEKIDEPARSRAKHFQVS
jgi:hypothetical protein